MGHGSRAGLLSFVFGCPPQSRRAADFVILPRNSPAGKGGGGFPAGLQRAKIGEGPGCSPGGRAFLCQLRVDKVFFQLCSERFFHFKISRCNSVPVVRAAPLPRQQSRNRVARQPLPRAALFAAACANAQPVAGESAALVRPNPASPETGGWHGLGSCSRPSPTDGWGHILFSDG